MLEWVPLSDGGKVTAVDPATLTLVTDFGRHQGGGRQRHPAAEGGRDRARRPASPTAPAGARSIPATFESKLVPGHPRHRRRRHRRRDAEIGLRRERPGQGLRGGGRARCSTARRPPAPKLINTCYSLVAPDYGISVAGVYPPVERQLAEVPGAGGISPPTRRARRARPKRCSPRPGSRPSPARCSAEHRSRPCDRVGGAACLAAAALAHVVGDAIPRLAHRRDGRPRARPRHRRQPPGRPLPALPQRALSRGALPGQPRARSARAPGGDWSEGQLRLRIVDSGRINPATIMPAYYRTDGLVRVAPGLARQAHPERGADRGRGGLPDDAAGTERTHGAIRVPPGLPADRRRRRGRAGRSRRSSRSSPRTRPPRRCRRPSARSSGRRAINAGPGQARPAAAVGERQRRAAHASASRAR